MRPKTRQHHFVYVTVCVTTGSYYIGVHSTNNLNDGYLGSGKRLGHSLRKHGRENHQFEIIQVLPSRKEAELLEAALVTWDLIHNDKACMNMAPGGQGGDRISQHPRRDEILAKKTYVWMKDNQYRQKMSDALKPKTTARLQQLQEQQRRMVQQQKDAGYKHSDETKGKISKNNKAGTEEVRAKLREANLGKKNPEHSARMVHRFENKANHYRTRVLCLTSPNGDNNSFLGRDDFNQFCSDNKISSAALIRANGHAVLAPKKSHPIANNTVGWCLIEKGWKK